MQTPSNIGYLKTGLNAKENGPTLEAEPKQRQRYYIPFAAGAIAGLLVSTLANYALAYLNPFLGTPTVLIGMALGSVCAFATGSSLAKANSLRVGLYCAAVVVIVWALVFLFITPTQEIVTSP
jgi:hypothetical protein